MRFWGREICFLRLRIIGALNVFFDRKAGVLSAQMNNPIKHQTQAFVQIDTWHNSDSILQLFALYMLLSFITDCIT